MTLKIGVYLYSAKFTLANVSLYIVTGRKIFTCSFRLCRITRSQGRLLVAKIE